MKKKGILNSHLSQVIAFMGHADFLCITDSGMPIPNNSVCVDLAVKVGLPRLLDVLDTILEELYVEEVMIADDMEKNSPDFYDEIKKRFKNIKLIAVPHNTLESMLPKMKGIVRTGENTPWANIILKAGCIY
jgi:D-ribose pyranase